MAEYAGLVINELLWIGMDVTTTPQNLPGMLRVSTGQTGVQSLRPDTGVPWNPGHALITVESGALRIRSDGVDPDAGIGTLYGLNTPNGPVIDWTSQLADFQGMMFRARVVRENPNTPTHISISYRN